MSAYHPLLEGAIDLHVHSYPSVFARKQTDWELIDEVKAANMAGVVIKAHEASTTDRTALIRMKEPALHVYGGVVCNHSVGGLNPEAVDTAIRSGAKLIWMPTISARQHANYFAGRSTRLYQSAQSLLHPRQPLCILQDDGTVREDVHIILDLISQANIVLATGHVSVPEVMALVDAAVEHKVQKILIQHTDLGIARVRSELERELISKGAILEKCYLACSRDFADITPQEMAESIRRLGADSCVMVSDFGQPHHVAPVAAMQQFVESMLAYGITSRQIQQMIVSNPRELLGV